MTATSFAESIALANGSVVSKLEVDQSTALGLVATGFAAFCYKALSVRVLAVNQAMLVNQNQAIAFHFPAFRRREIEFPRVLARESNSLSVKRELHFH